MDLEALKYSVFGGVRKNLHFPYYVHGFWMLAQPRCLYVRKREDILHEFDRLTPAQQDYVMKRVNYYNRLVTPHSIPDDSPTLSQQSYFKKERGSVYLFDTYEWNRYFPGTLKWQYAPGDITQTFSVPTITKSRPIVESRENPNSIMINIEKVRHFMFFDDPIPFEQKRDIIFFRGAVTGKPHRMVFLEKYFNDPLFDILDTAKDSVYPEEMRQHIETTIYGHLKYKYIMSLEGNDVASNLKWIMNSNSIAVSPALKYETWFMEGTLVPNEHYIQVKSDYSDVAEKIAYYNDHPAEARDIVAHAHEHCRQFFDKRQERLISLMVMAKYFKMTGQQL